MHFVILFKGHARIHSLIQALFELVFRRNKQCENSQIRVGRLWARTF